MDWLRRSIALLVICSSCFVAAVNAHATDGPRTFYIGHFSGGTARDVPTCGTRTRPCKTLAYWNTYRRQQLQPGDSVHIAPGHYLDRGKLKGTGMHCILLDRYARGVTYEGRDAHDAPARSSSAVDISLAGVSTVAFTGSNPCGERGIGPVDASRCNTPQWSSADDYSGFTARNLLLHDAHGLGIYLCGAASAPPSGVTFDHVRVVRTAGVLVGAFRNDYDDADCTSEGRWVQRVSFTGVEVAGPSSGFPGGLLLACMDTASIAHAYVHDTGEHACPDASAPGCDDHDGIGGSGAINVSVRDSEVTRVGEDGVDVGGHPGGKSHDWFVDRVASHDNPGGNFKASGGQRVTIRNSMSWGRGIGFTSYSAAHDIRLVNNTFWGSDRAVMMYAYETRSVIENNVFVTTSAQPAVWLDEASTNDTNVWRTNVVVNTGGGPAFAEFPGDALDRPRCDGWNPQHTSYVEAFDLSKVSNPPAIPCPLGAPASPSWVPATAAGLNTLRAASAAGMWFGAATASGDRWGTQPDVVDAHVTGPSSLVLRATDTVARSAGRPEPDVTVDFFGRPRIGPLDIGAT